MSAPAMLRWTDADGTHEHDLARPLMQVSSRARRAEWRLDTNAGVIHSERAATTVYEIEGTIRFEADPSALLAALSERLGRSLTYFERRFGLFVPCPCVLLRVDSGGAGLDPDPDRFGQGEYSARIALRRTDGGSFTDLWGAFVPGYLIDDDGDVLISAAGPADYVLVTGDGDDLVIAESGEPAATLLIAPSGDVYIVEV